MLTKGELRNEIERINDKFLLKSEANDLLSANDEFVDREELSMKISEMKKMLDEKVIEQIEDVVSNLHLSQKTYGRGEVVKTVVLPRGGVSRELLYGDKSPPDSSHIVYPTRPKTQVTVKRKV